MNPTNHMLQDKKVIIGISGGIAAYKAAELIRLLRKKGAITRVVATQSACQFITPLTLQALSGHPTLTHLLDAESEAAMDHISLARWADCIIIAPSSANIIARIAHGFADDLLTTLILATEAPLFIAPAMNRLMWSKTATQENIKTLASRGVEIIGPADGEQACGEVGPGRMADPEVILSHLKTHFLPAPTATIFEQRTFVITAGPTREAIDPVRYLTNRSSGKMGFALAQAAQQMGADVILISGPVQRPTPKGVKRIDVVSAQEMLDATVTACKNADVFIATAAVADYTLETVANQKIKKGHDRLQLSLKKTVDILATISLGRSSMDRAPFCVGFAAETDNLRDYALKKLKSKRLNMVIANDVSRTDIGFNSDQNQVTVFDHHSETALPLAPKERLAETLLNIVAETTHTNKRPSC